MRLILRLLLAAYVVLSCKQDAISQSLDSIFVAKASRNLIWSYLTQQSNDAPIYNGRVYQPYVRLDDNGHTFFHEKQYAKGAVSYLGYTYKHVDIAYDIVRDQLLLVNFNKSANIILMPQYVDSFSFRDHIFLNLRTEEIKKNEISPGYYELLHKGELILIAKRTKEITETLSQSDIKRTVSTNNRYYLLKDSVYRSVKNKGDLMRLLKSTHSQNQQYIRVNKLNFRRDKEKMISSLVKFHESIRN